MNNEFNKYPAIDESWSCYESNAKWERDNTTSFGIDFLDDCLDGLSPVDLVLISGYSGGGKSECATILAERAALSGKRVSFFALEAEKNEIAYRIAYRKFMACVNRDKLYGDYDFRYSQFIRGLPAQVVSKYKFEIDTHMAQISSKLVCRYPDEDFTVDQMAHDLDEVKSISDLIIIDHLHYFDLDSENENVAMKAIVKNLKLFISQSGVPVILVAHIRKQNSTFVQKIIPDADDIHGSSDTIKISTKAIMLASGWSVRFVDSDGNEVVYPKTTLFRCVKSRRDGSTSHYLGALKFSPGDGGYESGYLIGRQYRDKHGVAFQILDDNPLWAKNVKRRLS